VRRLVWNRITDADSDDQSGARITGSLLPASAIASASVGFTATIADDLIRGVSQCLDALLTAYRANGLPSSSSSSSSSSSCLDSSKSILAFRAALRVLLRGSAIVRDAIIAVFGAVVERRAAALLDQLCSGGDEKGGQVGYGHGKSGNGFESAGRANAAAVAQLLSLQCAVREASATLFHVGGESDTDAVAANAAVNVSAAGLGDNGSSASSSHSVSQRKLGYWAADTSALVETMGARAFARAWKRLGAPEHVAASRQLAMAYDVALDRTRKHGDHGSNGNKDGDSSIDASSVSPLSNQALFRNQKPRGETLISALHALLGLLFHGDNISPPSSSASSSTSSSSRVAAGPVAAVDLTSALRAAGARSAARIRAGAAVATEAGVVGASAAAAPVVSVPLPLLPAPAPATAAGGKASTAAASSSSSSAAVSAAAPSASPSSSSLALSASRLRLEPEREFLHFYQRLLFRRLARGRSHALTDESAQQWEQSALLGACAHLHSFGGGGATASNQPSVEVARMAKPYVGVELKVK
jgi:hypothetical protein